jgi:hypothetical protein
LGARGRGGAGSRQLLLADHKHGTAAQRSPPVMQAVAVVLPPRCTAMLTACRGWSQLVHRHHSAMAAASVPTCAAAAAPAP